MLKANCQMSPLKALEVSSVAYALPVLLPCKHVVVIAHLEAYIVSQENVSSISETCTFFLSCTSDTVLLPLITL